MKRRHILTTIGASLSFATAGCLQGGSSNNEGSATAGSDVGYDTHQLGAVLATHASSLRFDTESSVGAVELYESSKEAYRSVPLDLGPLADRRSTNEAFIDATDFESELLIYVVTEWPLTNQSEIEVENLTLSGDTLVGTVRAIGDNAEEGDQAPMFPAGLVRVSVDDAHLTTVEVTVVDGRDNEEVFEEAYNG
ncbi:uncharacterized protein Nmag_3079 [Natrialba magadii ATCC 43099]|uniref:Uncharacterized protein n=1 Tax=Natrialba magadii (strain ATCC 43099 / DSM 3394 / CCM 3739 / CIP 104546 / IAM 13178 / JCM 8861 / NBRC 102185 / NCIMB 2190 / MS3) TaxID=547559 RepID=D3SR75_NATMM|nr:hypothetical protein [Natrialba magadii]ADD06631.1 uncharacterized protein Nmag_3079 [Natrialba magadii ATCC 43099]